MPEAAARWSRSRSPCTDRGARRRWWLVPLLANARFAIGFSHWDTIAQYMFMDRAACCRSMRGLAFLLVTGCATPYATTVRWVDPDLHVAADGGEVREDADVAAALRVDGAAVLLDLTNKTDEVLQVDWSGISLSRPDGLRAALRPDVDLGWIP